MVAIVRKSRCYLRAKLMRPPHRRKDEREHVPCVESVLTEAAHGQAVQSGPEIPSKSGGR